MEIGIIPINYSMYILQKHKFTLETLIMKTMYIKDLFGNPSNIGHWVYKINGADILFQILDILL